MENNKLVSSAETCEQCHARDKPISPRLRVIPSYKDDEANTRTTTVLLMRIATIHAAHLGPGIHIRYAAADKKRQTIPWVEYTNQTGATRSYLASWFLGRICPIVAHFRDAVRRLPQSRLARVRTAGPRSQPGHGLGPDRRQPAFRQERIARPSQGELR